MVVMISHGDGGKTTFHHAPWTLGVDWMNGHQTPPATGTPWAALPAKFPLVACGSIRPSALEDFATGGGERRVVA